MGAPRPCYRSISIVADGRLDVCDGAHWAFVMKKVKGPALRFAIGWVTRPGTGKIARSCIHLQSQRKSLLCFSCRSWQQPSWLF
jgi:hypothetical protein